jgi:signal transduction histidine kinase
VIIIGDTIKYQNYKQTLIQNYKNKYTNHTQQIREDYRLLFDKLQYDFKMTESQNIKKIDELYSYYQNNKDNFDIEKAVDYLNRDVKFGEYQIFFINKQYIIEKTSYKKDLGYNLGEYKALRELFDSLFDKKVEVDISSIKLNTTDFKRYLLKLSDDEKYLLQIGFSLNIYDDLKEKYNYYDKRVDMMDVYLANEYHIQRINFGNIEPFKKKKDFKYGWQLTKKLLNELIKYSKLQESGKEKIIKLLNSDVKIASIKLNEEIDTIFTDDKLINNLDLKNNSFIIYSITDGLFNKASETKLIIKTNYSTKELQDDIDTLFNQTILQLFIVLSVLFLIYLFILKTISNKLLKIIENIKHNQYSEIENIQVQEIDTLNNSYNNLHNKLNQEIKLNENLLKDNKRFIADTVHQIRTPLTNIMMNGEMVKEYQHDDTLTAFIDQIDASVNMLSNSYEDLAYVTTYDSIEYKPTKVLVSDILQQRIKFFTTISKVNFKDIVPNIQSDIYTYINEIELERIIDNNISNGVKYADDDKPITINLFKNTDTITLEFKSFGKPIKNKELLFEKNYREDDSKRGLGLGLNMVKIICDKYNITYNVTYQDNQNIFTYTFKTM